eukprot:3121752-Rhodomonas_salina.2
MDREVPRRGYQLQPSCRPLPHSAYGCRTGSYNLGPTPDPAAQYGLQTGWKLGLTFVMKLLL